MREKKNTKVTYSAMFMVQILAATLLLYDEVYIDPKNLRLALDGLYIKLDHLGQCTITIIILSQQTSLLKICKTITDFKILELRLDCYCS